MRRLYELKRHIRQAQEVTHDQELKKAAKQESELHKATLTLHSAVSAQVRGPEGPPAYQRGRGRGHFRGRGHGRGRPWNNRQEGACHTCGQMVHWKNECPNQPSGGPQHQQADWGRGPQDVGSSIFTPTCHKREMSHHKYTHRYTL